MFRKGLCCAHLKRLQRNKPVDGLIGKERADRGLELAEVLDPMEKVIETGSTFLEASSEDDTANRLARRAFIKACEALMVARGWTPPARSPRSRTRTRLRRRA